MSHATYISELINEKEIRIVAEIGVLRSKFTCQTLRETEPDLIKEYWAIDPWEVITDSRAHWKMTRHSAETMQYFYWWACKHMVAHPVLKVMRLRSVDAAKCFEDGYFDLVYIDALHYYEHVVSDIKAWLSKVKKGGIISGHDYNWEGVKAAVDELIGTDKLTIGRHNVWWKEIK